MKRRAHPDRDVPLQSEPCKPGSENKTPEEGRAKVDEIVGQGRRLRQGLDRRPGRPSSEAHAGVHRRGHGPGAQAQQDHRMAHIVELADARRMVDQGVNILVHNVRDQEIRDDFIATLKEKNVSVISTLGTRGRHVRLRRRADGARSPTIRSSPRGCRRSRWRCSDQEARRAGQRCRTARAGAQFDTDKKNLKKLVDTGMRIGFGTDCGGAPDRYFIQGFFEHRQMELMRDAGLTPMQMIQSFSKNNAETLGIDKDFGTLAKGKAADLLVLTRNPLDDITNMRTIEAVYLGGKKFE